MDELGGIVRVDLAAQIAHVHIHDVRAAAVVIVPEMVFNALAREHDAAVADHIFQQRKFLGRERDRAPAARNMMRSGIDREVRHGEDIGRAAAVLARDDTQPRQKLIKRKRLDEIVKQLERGDAPLSESLKLFEEGTALISNCDTLLSEAEQKVVKLRKGQNGEPEELPFGE